MGREMVGENESLNLKGVRGGIAQDNMMVDQAVGGWRVIAQDHRVVNWGWGNRGKDKKGIYDSRMTVRARG